jgi:predicted RNase H-like HicB family nuclease
MKFTLAIHKEKYSSYGVTVPDISGCFSAGDSLEDAIENTKEATALHLETLVELNMPLPLEALSKEHHMKNSDYNGAIFAVIEIDMSAFI